MLADGNDVLPVGDFLPDCFTAIQAVAALVNIGDLHRLANAQFAGIRLLRPGQHAEQGGFTGTIGPDYTNNTAGG